MFVFLSLAHHLSLRNLIYNSLSQIFKYIFLFCVIKIPYETSFCSKEKLSSKGTLMCTWRADNSLEGQTSTWQLAAPSSPANHGNMRSHISTKLEGSGLSYNLNLFTLHHIIQRRFIEMQGAEVIIHEFYHRLRVPSLLQYVTDNVQDYHKGDCLEHQALT